MKRVLYNGVEYEEHWRGTVRAGQRAGQVRVRLRLAGKPKSKNVWANASDVRVIESPETKHTRGFIPCDAPGCIPGVCDECGGSGKRAEPLKEN